MVRRNKLKLEIFFTSKTVIINSVEHAPEYLASLYNRDEHFIEINHKDKHKLNALFGGIKPAVVYRKRLSDKVFVADFETCDTEDGDGVRVYAAAITPISNPYDVTIITNIEDFLSHCKTLPEKSKIYFHNLGFDGAFIVDYLMRNNEAVEVSIFSRKWYAVKWAGFEFRDSLKLLPGTSVKDMPKQFNLPIMKLDENYDYKRVRKIGEELTPDEIQYIKNDVTIVALTMQRLIEAGFNITYLTIGSFVYAMINKSMDKDVKRSHEDITPEDDQILRKAYYGGYTAVNERYKGKTVHNLTAVDYNSMYPSMMLYTPMPIGKPHYLDGSTNIDEYIDEHHFVIVEFEAENVTLKSGCYPTLTRKGFVAKYQSHFDVFTASLVWSDYARARRNYTFGGLTIKRYIVFNATTGDFNHVIEGLKNLKEKASELDEKGRYVQAGVRQFAKLCLNSMYGKFAQSLVNEKRLIWLDEKEDHLVETPDPEQEIGKGKYLPVSIAVTAAAREALFSVYDRIGYDRVVYSDTDSIYIKDYKGEIADLIHDSDFGKWAIERAGFSGKFLHAKCYMVDYGKYKDIKVAGLPKTADISKVSFDDFEAGLLFSKVKLIPKYVRGGVRLNEVDFTIKDIK